MIYFQIFILNPVICIVTLWLLFKLCLHRLLKRLPDKRIDETLKRLLSADEISDKLVPIAEDLRDTIPKIIPGHVKFLGRSFYKRTNEILESLTDKKKLKELVEVILEEINLPEIVRKTLLKSNPGLIQLCVTRIQPWIIGTGLILGVLMALLQLILQH